jgi:hypothetical protein
MQEQQSHVTFFQPVAGNQAALERLISAGLNLYEALVSCLRSSHPNCAVILSGVWPFSGQTESKDLRLLFSTYALNY